MYEITCQPAKDKEHDRGFEPADNGGNKKLHVAIKNRFQVKANVDTGQKRRQVQTKWVCDKNGILGGRASWR